MTDAQRAVDSALSEAERLRSSLRKGTSKQVSSDDERRVIKATALTWFNNHRNTVVAALGEDPVLGTDEAYKSMLAAGEKSTLRTRHLASVKRLKEILAKLQSEHAVSLATSQTSPEPTPDTAPLFTTLVPDAKMQAILANRWSECVKCVDGAAPLAATVMMGGLLEGLLLAKINQLVNKAPAFTAKSAPKDKNDNTLKLNEWGLKNYIDVAHELGWISQTTKDIGAVVRDYRNYIHPQKEYSHGSTISSEDARMLWEVAKSVMRQILKP